MSVTLYAENYRALRKIKWELPKGVCALVGPNGSGKTTLLEVPELLRSVMYDGFSKLGGNRGFEGLRNLQAAPAASVKLGIDLEEIKWHISVDIDDDRNSIVTFRELLHEGDALLFDRAPGKDEFTYNGSVRRGETTLHALALDKYLRPKTNTLNPPVSWLAEYRLYRPYNLDQFRQYASPVSAENTLSVSGQNALTVLRNWRDSRETEVRSTFVMDRLRGAFPDVFSYLDFVPSEHSVGGIIISPQSDARTPIRSAPNGLLTTLLHLCAIVSAPRGGIVAIDEPENGLHPFAIKQLISAAHEWADEQDVTVLFATHSPVIIDEFKKDPEHLFVMQTDQEVLPVRLDQMRDAGWLSQFSLGDLYKYGDFGAPAESHAGA
jgi:predicted ATPase